MLFGLVYLRSKNLHEFHNACLGIIQAMTVTYLFTNGCKLYAGRYRPDWYARNNPNDNQGRVSFPSGHSSWSFCAMTYLSLYLAGMVGMCSELHVVIMVVTVNVGGRLGGMEVLGTDK